MQEAIHVKARVFFVVDPVETGGEFVSVIKSGDSGVMVMKMEQVPEFKRFI